MTQYIPYPTIADADTRSREWWLSVLGRDKVAEDVTEYVYVRRQRTGDEEADADLPDGVDVAIVVQERDDTLDGLLRADQMTADELAALVALYPDYQVAVAYSVDDLVAYGGLLYRIVQSHSSQSDWTPDRTPALYTPATPEGIIGTWVAPTGAHDAYNLGALVTHNGQTWESLIAANVWMPGSVGTGALWRVVES